MTKPLLAVALACVLGLAPVSAVSQTREPKGSIRLAGRVSAEHVTAAQLRDYLSFVASDLMEGRDTPSRGLDTTARFIATLLSRWGFRPAGDPGSFFQSIDLSRSVITPAESSLSLSGRAYGFGDEWFARPMAGTADAGLVYASHGWVNEAKGVDPYRGLDVKGRIVVVQLSYFPPGGTFQDVRKGSGWTRPSRAAADRGAVAVVYVPTRRGLDGWDRLRSLFGTDEFSPVKLRETDVELPSVVANATLVQALFAGERADSEAIWKSFDAGTAADGFALDPGKKLALKIAVRDEKATTQNVVAVWPGSDAVLAGEYVAFGAHYDHIGLSDSAKDGDNINNGADDDGSGTVALLAMAEALAKTPRRPKRSILFVWHCGEEKGLWGSDYFTQFPTVPLDRVVAQLNIDMIGRTKAASDTNPRNAVLSGPHEVYAIGSRMMSDDLGRALVRVNGAYLKLLLNEKYDDPADPQRLFYRSDHFNYARKGIPIIFFFSGLHEDYHQVSDQVEKIDFAKYEQITRTVYVLGWQIAEAPARPRVDRPLPATVAEAE